MSDAPEATLEAPPPPSANEPAHGVSFKPYALAILAAWTYLALQCYLLHILLRIKQGGALGLIMLTFLLAGGVSFILLFDFVCQRMRLSHD